MSADDVAIKLWQTAMGGAEPADGVVGSVSWRLLGAEPITRRERKVVAHRKRLVARAMRRLRDRHDRCWREAIRAHFPWSHA
jgi:hypothetical protein